MWERGKDSNAGLRIKEVFNIQIYNEQERAGDHRGTYREHNRCLKETALYTQTADWKTGHSFGGELPILTKEFSALVMDLLRWDKVFTTALTNLFQYGFKSIRTVKSSFVIKTNICDGEVIKERHAKMLWEKRILWECALHQVNCDNMNQDY